MARDRGLEALLHDDLAEHAGLEEKGMFGGRVWLRDGHLVCGARADGLLFRLGKGRDGEALQLAGVAPMSSGERLIQGWVRLAPEACGDDVLRQRLLGEALAFARTLPPK